MAHLCKQRRDCSITKYDLIKLWNDQNGLCAITKRPMILDAQHPYPFRPSVDRIDNSKGYHIANIRLVWYFVNVARNKWTDDQLIECCDAVVKGSRR